MKMKMKIGVVGYGIVGKALAGIFSNKVDVFIYDKYIEEHKEIGNVVKNSDVIFVAVPTPMENDGSIDLSYIQDALGNVQNNVGNEKKIVVLRSTMIPGTTQKLQEDFPSLSLVFNPEFLSERNYKEDMENTNRIILGGEREICEKVKEIYEIVFPNVKYILTNTRTAEMIKYSANVTLVGQVMIANELYQIAEKLDVDWKTVRDTIVLDDLIGKNNNVPGPDGSLGFGGKCLPKDLNAMICLSESLGYSPKVLKQFWETNLKLRSDRNWEQIRGATSEKGFKSI